MHQQPIASFERHTKGIGSKILQSWGWRDGRGLGKHEQGRPVPILPQQRPNPRSGLQTPQSFPVASPSTPTPTTPPQPNFQLLKTTHHTLIQSHFQTFIRNNFELPHTSNSISLSAFLHHLVHEEEKSKWIGILLGEMNSAWIEERENFHHLAVLFHLEWGDMVEGEDLCMLGFMLLFPFFRYHVFVREGVYGSEEEVEKAADCFVGWRQHLLPHLNAETSGYWREGVQELVGRVKDILMDEWQIRDVESNERISFVYRVWWKALPQTQIFFNTNVIPRMEGMVGEWDGGEDDLVEVLDRLESWIKREFDLEEVESIIFNRIRGIFEVWERKEEMKRFCWLLYPLFPRLVDDLVLNFLPSPFTFWLLERLMCREKREDVVGEIKDWDESIGRSMMKLMIEEAEFLLRWLEVMRDMLRKGDFLNVEMYYLNTRWLLNELDLARHSLVIKWRSVALVEIGKSIEHHHVNEL